MCCTAGPAQKAQNAFCVGKSKPRQVSLSVIVTSSSGKARPAIRHQVTSTCDLCHVTQAERAMLVIQGNPERFCLTAKAAADGQPAAILQSPFESFNGMASSRCL